MAQHNLLAIHDRIDEEHFEIHLHAGAIAALQQRVIVLEAAVRELRVEAFGGQAGESLPRHPAAEVPPLRDPNPRSRGRTHAPRLA